MKKILIILTFINSLISLDYDELEKDFKTMSSSDFKQYIKQELKNYSGDDIEILRLEFWNIRLLYADGNIEKAIDEYVLLNNFY